MRWWRDAGARAPQARAPQQVLWAATAPWLLPPGTPQAAPTDRDILDALAAVRDALAQLAHDTTALDQERTGNAYLSTETLREVSVAMDGLLTERVHLEGVQAGLIGAAAAQGIDRGQVQAAGGLDDTVLTCWYRVP